MAATLTALAGLLTAGLQLRLSARSGAPLPGTGALGVVGMGTRGGHDVGRPVRVADLLAFPMAQYSMDAGRAWLGQCLGLRPHWDRGLAPSQAEKQPPAHACIRISNAKREGMTEQATAAKRETRTRILDAALRLFQHNGFEKTTMRHIAKEAGMAVGAAYYYFKSKDELVLAFYEQTGEEALRYNLESIAQSKDFKVRFRAILTYKLQQLAPYRTLVSVLARNAAEIGNPLSPFSPQTKTIREDAMGLIEAAIDGSNLKVAKQLRPVLPKLLWFYQMGIIFFWSQDISAQQQRTEQLMDHSLTMLMRLMRLSDLPLMSGVNRHVIKLIRLIEGVQSPSNHATDS